MSGSPKNPQTKARGEASSSSANAGPAGLAGDGLSRGNVIQLKGGQVAPVGGSGIRSPLKQSGGKPVGQRPEPSPNPPAPPSNPTPIEAPRVVSQIRGFNDQNYGFGGTQLGAVMYDSFSGKRNRFLMILLVLLTCGAAVLGVMYPKERKRVLNTITEAKDDLIGMVRYKKRKVAKGRDASDEETGFASESEPGKESARSRSQAAPVTSGASKGCKFLVQQGVGAGAKLTLADQVDLAECYLVQDDLLNAEGALRSAELKIQRASEAELNAMKSNRTLVDAYHALLLSRLRAGKAREASELVRGRCNTWAQTNTCVAKMMLLADRRVPGGGEGAQVMFGSQGRLDGKAQARLWLAGAQLAVADGRTPVADQRYALALSSAPKGAMALRKQIYETQALDLYNRGEVIKLKDSTAKATADLGTLNASSKSLLKIKMFQDLSTSTGKNRTKTVKSLLTKEEVTFRARGDFDLIEVLGPESIRAGLEDDYLRLLKRTRDFYQSKYKTLGAVEKRLTLWEIRTTLSKGRYDWALPMIDRYAKLASNDALSYHLRGVAYVGMADKGSQITAAQQFQAALKGKRNWESLYALGVTMVRAGKAEAVAPIIKDLDKLITTNGQRYWVEMLKAEWYLEKGKLLNAQKILTGWVKKEPDYFVPRQLLVKLYKKQGKPDETAAAEDEITKLARTLRPGATFEGFASPLGVMALAHRPID